MHEDKKITHLLSNTVIINLSKYTTQQLEKSGLAPKNIHEFKEFLGTRWLHIRPFLSMTMFFDNMKKTAKTQILVDAI